MKLNHGDKFLLSLVIFILVLVITVGIISYKGNTPQKQFLASPIGNSYHYKAWDDKKYQQALDSGWISQDVFDLICDLELEGKNYGIVIGKSNAILDSVKNKTYDLGFPFSMPDICTNEEIRSFLQSNHDDIGWWGVPEKKEMDKWYIHHPGDSLLVEYESRSVQRNGVDYSSSYSTCYDTVVSMTLSTTDKVLDVMNFKFGECLIYEDKSEEPYVSYNKDVTTRNHYYYTWINDDFIVKLHEYEYSHKYNTHYEYYFGQKDMHEFTSTITYTNRNVLHSYYKAYKKARFEYEEQERLRKEKERIEKTRKEQEKLHREQERQRQDSIRRAAGAILNL